MFENHDNKYEKIELLYFVVMTIPSNIYDLPIPVSLLWRNRLGMKNKQTWNLITRHESFLSSIALDICPIWEMSYFCQSDQKDVWHFLKIHTVRVFNFHHHSLEGIHLKCSKTCLFYNLKQISFFLKWCVPCWKF